MRKRLLLAVAFIAATAFASALHADERARAEQTMAMLEERKMKPLVATVAKFIIDAGHGRMDAARAGMQFDEKVGSMMQNDPGLRFLRAKAGGFKDVELVGYSMVSTSMVELFVLVPTSEGHVGFIVGVSNHNGRACVGAIAGATDWEEILEMKKRVELYPATVTMEFNEKKESEKMKSEGQGQGQ